MALSKLFVNAFGFVAISIFSFTISGFTDIELLQDCNKIDANVEVVNTTNGLSNGHVKVTLTRGSAKNLKFVFCVQTTGQVLNENRFDNNSLEGLPKGDYFCIVHNVDCSKKINFTIE